MDQFGIYAVTVIMKNHPHLEIGQIFNGPKDMKSPEGVSTLQPAIYRHSKNTWFVGSALSMPGWKELDHKFYKIIDGDHRMIEYCCDWIAQFHDVKRAWVWFDILSRGVSLSNSKEHLKQIRKRRKARDKKPVIIEDPPEKEEPQKPEPQAPKQGDLFGGK
jgi:hypothetical protein